MWLSSVKSLSIDRAGQIVVLRWPGLYCCKPSTWWYLLKSCIYVEVHPLQTCRLVNLLLRSVLI